MFIYFEYEFHTQPYASGKKPGGHKSANMLTTNACGLMVPKASSIVQRPSTTDSETKVARCFCRAVGLSACSRASRDADDGDGAAVTPFSEICCNSWS